MGPRPSPQVPPSSPCFDHGQCAQSNQLFLSSNKSPQMHAGNGPESLQQTPKLVLTLRVAPSWLFFRWRIFPDGSRPTTKPGNKGSISGLIRLQNGFSGKQKISSRLSQWGMSAPPSSSISQPISCASAVFTNFRQ